MRTRRARLTRVTLTAATAAIALSGCATFTDNDVVARVDDAELGFDEFRQRLDAQGEIVEGAENGTPSRAVISNWLALELSRSEGLVDLYETGPADSGVLCVMAVNVADAAGADAAIERLRNGTDWSDFVAETDPLIPDDGRQQCIATDAVGPLFDQISDISIDDPYRALVFDDGSVAVLRMQQISELNAIELLSNYQLADPEAVGRVIESAEDADIYVNPQFGAFDSELFNVTPLG